MHRCLGLLGLLSAKSGGLFIISNTPARVRFSQRQRAASGSVHSAENRLIRNFAARSDPSKQYENDNDDQDDPENTDATVTVAVAVAAEAAAEATEQENN